MPKPGAIGSSKGPKISNAGKPSSKAPMITRVTTAAIMNMLADPCSTENSVAICCGSLAMVSDQEKVLAVLVMKSTIPAFAVVVVTNDQSCLGPSDR